MRLKLLRDRRGGTTIEYCMIAALITFGLIAAMQLWGETASGMYSSLAEQGWSGGADGEGDGGGE